MADLSRLARAYLVFDALHFGRLVLPVLASLKTLCFYGLSLFFCSSILATSARAEEASTSLLDLELIASESPTLKDFLASADLRERYYESLRNYFGWDRLPRKSYDKILEQLEIFSRRFPEIAVRAWQKNESPKLYEITLETKSSGLILKTKAFEKWLDNYLESLEPADSSRSTQTRLSQFINSTATRFEEEMRATEVLPRKQRLSEQQRLVGQLRADPAFNEIAAIAILNALKSEEISDQLRSGDADTVISTFEFLRVKRDFSALGEPLPGSLQSFVARLIPKLDLPQLEVVQDKAAETDLFSVDVTRTKYGRLIPVGTSASARYVFHQLPRRFHGIFKGIPNRECVSGDAENLDSLTPERWATVLLEDSETYYIEKTSGDRISYQGFEQRIAGSIGARSFTSVDLGSPLFRKKSPIHGHRQFLFFDHWLQIATQQKPAGWGPFVIGEANGGDNSGVLRFIRKRPAYLFGDIVNQEDPWVIQDDLAKKLAALGIRTELAAKYAGRMIYDAVINPKSNLTALNPANDELPEVVSLQDAIVLLAQKPGSLAQEVLGEMLLPRLKAFPAGERDLFLKAIESKSIPHTFAIAVYNSKLISKLNSREADFLRGAGETGVSILKAKGGNLSARFQEILAAINHPDQLTPARSPREIEVFPNHLELLNAAIKDDELGLEAALVLQVLGHQSQASDEIVTKKFSKETVQKIHLILHYLDKTPKPSDDFVKAALAKGIHSGYNAIQESCIALISRAEKLDDTAFDKIEKAIFASKNLRMQIRLANVLRQHQAKEAVVQQVYISTIGADGYDKKGFQGVLLGYPKLWPAALESAAWQLSKSDNDRRWAYVTFFRDAPNVDPNDLKAAFEAGLQDKSDDLRLASARILMSRGVVVDAAVDRLLLKGRNREVERSEKSLPQGYVPSEKVVAALVERIANNDCPWVAMVFLLWAKTIGSEHVPVLRALQESKVNDVAISAARVLLHFNQVDVDSHWALGRAIGDNSWSQETVVADLESAIQAHRPTDAFFVWLPYGIKKNPEKAKRLARLIPKEALQIRGASEEDVAVFMKLSTHRLSPKQGEKHSLARLLTNRYMPAIVACYELLNESLTKDDLGVRDLLVANLERASAAGALYAAILLDAHFSYSNARTRKILAPHFFESISVARQAWEPVDLLAILNVTRQKPPRSQEEKDKFYRAFAASALSREVEDELFLFLVSKNEVLIEIANQVITHHLSLDPSAERQERYQSFWLKKLREEAIVDEAYQRVKSLKLSEASLREIRSLLQDKSEKIRSTAAVLLERSGEWNSLIESTIFDIVKVPGNWKREYFIDVMNKHKLSTLILKRKLAQLTETQEQFPIAQALGKIRLSAQQIRVVQSYQQHRSPGVRSFTAAILVDLKKTDRSTAAALASFQDTRIQEKWLISAFKGLRLDQGAVAAFKRKMNSSNSELRSYSRQVFFGLGAHSLSQREYLRSLLDSQDESLRVNAADILYKKYRSARAEAVLVWALLHSELWNTRYLFHLLEPNTQLSAASQLLLAAKLAADPQDDESHAVTLLRNQLKLYPKPAELLKGLAHKTQIKEILSNKRPSRLACEDRAA